MRTRCSISSSRSDAISRSTGTPPTWQVLRTGTMSSPWPPSTMAETLSTERFNSWAIKVR